MGERSLASGRNPARPKLDPADPLLRRLQLGPQTKSRSHQDVSANVPQIETLTTLNCVGESVAARTAVGQGAEAKLSVCLCLPLFLFTYACMYVCMYVCILVYIYLTASVRVCPPACQER